MNAHAEMPTRPMYWSVRREIWENRAVYMAPLIVASLVLFTSMFATFMLPWRMARLATLEVAKQREILSMPYNAAAGTLIMTAFLVGFFYCLDALNSERRDRSILFWKSLPVSDQTTVLSKLSIPLVVLPVLVFVIAITAQLIMLMLSTLVLMGNPANVARLWNNVKFFQTAIAFLYGLIAIVLWHAPLYSWLLLISAWAKRAAVLWALLPLVAIFMVEWLTFRTSYFAKFIGDRLVGWFQLAFIHQQKGAPKVALDPLEHLTPWNLLSAPGLWLGLIFAAGFVLLAIKLRRNREPV